MAPSFSRQVKQQTADTYQELPLPVTPRFLTIRHRRHLFRGRAATCPLHGTWNVAAVRRPHTEAQASSRCDRPRRREMDAGTVQELTSARSPRYEINTVSPVHMSQLGPRRLCTILDLTRCWDRTPVWSTYALRDLFLALSSELALLPLPVDARMEFLGMFRRPYLLPDH